MNLIHYVVLPFLVGMATYTFSRWVVYKKTGKLQELLREARKTGKEINYISLIMSNNNEWSAYSELVLSSLERIEGVQESMRKEMSNMKVQIGKLNVKSGIYGFIGSAGALAIALLIGYLKN